jgi:hypothetical protein
MPYQTLVLGDPLCRPFAFLAEVGLEGADPAAPWKGTVEVRARVDAAPGHGPERVELWVDGRRAAEGAPDAALPWDTATVPDGVHDVRLVAIETGPVATRSSRRFEVSVANGSDSVTVARAPETVTWGDPVRLEGKATGPGAVEVVRGREVLATAEVSGGTWKAEIPSPRLGPGPVALGVRGTRDGKVAALAAPVRLAVVSPTKRTLPRAVVEADLLPGLRAVVTDTSGAEKEGTVVGLSGGEGRNFGHDLNAMGAAGAKKARLEGYLRVAQAGDWDLEVRVPARIRLALGGREVIALAEPPPGGRATARVALEPGFHDVVLEVEGADVSRLALLLGGPQAAGPVAGRDLFHAATGRVRADAPEAAVHSGTTPAPEAIDGNREGKAVDLPPEGLEVHWKKTARNLESVVLIPRRGRDDARVPSDWIVETRAGTTGKWKPVTGLRTVLTPSFEAPTKDGERDPTAIEIFFEKVSVRQLRVRPSAAAPPVRLLEVLVFAKGK